VVRREMPPTIPPGGGVTNRGGRHRSNSLRSQQLKPEKRGERNANFCKERTKLFQKGPQDATEGEGGQYHHKRRDPKT